MNINSVIVTGNLTRDPELRFTPNGSPVANFGLAVNRRPSKSEQAQTCDFFNIVAWGKTAELCNDYLSKGSPVAIEGRLQSRSWQGEDGVKRSTVEVVAENIQFLSGRNESAEAGDDLVDQDIPFS